MSLVADWSLPELDDILAFNMVDEPTSPLESNMTNKAPHHQQNQLVNNNDPEHAISTSECGILCFC